MELLAQSRSLLATLDAAGKTKADAAKAANEARTALAAHQRRMSEIPRQGDVAAKLDATLARLIAEVASSPISETGAILESVRAALAALPAELAKIRSAGAGIELTLKDTLKAAEQALADAEKERKASDDAYAQHKAEHRATPCAHRAPDGTLTFPGDLFAAASLAEKKGGVVLTPKPEEMASLQAEAEVQEKRRKLNAEASRLRALIEAPARLARVEAELAALKG